MALTGVLGVAPNALGVSLGRPGDALGRLLAALGAPGASQDRLWGGIWVSKTVPSASGRVPETALGAPTDPKSIFRRFFGDLGFIFVDFPKILRRSSLKPPATKPQNQNLKKESRDPHRTSWLLRWAVASHCSYVFRDDFRTLHVQPFFVAYPQAHLVNQ